MAFAMRRSRDEDDYRRIRSFLRAVLRLGGCPGGNGQAAGFDGLAVSTQIDD